MYSYGFIICPHPSVSLFAISQRKNILLWIVAPFSFRQILKIMPKKGVVISIATRLYLMVCVKKTCIFVGSCRVVIANDLDSHALPWIDVLVSSNIGDSFAAEVHHELAVKLCSFVAITSMPGYPHGIP